MANSLLNQMNKIQSTISLNDKIVWGCQASTKCYNDEIQRIKDEEKRLTMEKRRTDEFIKESKPLVDILEKCYEIQVETLKISIESLVTHRLHQRCIEKNVEEHKRECDHLLGEHSDHLEQHKRKLQSTNPLFKVLEEKRIELKKSKIRCLDWQQRIKSQKRIDEQKLHIQKLIFYADTVSFAKAWVDKKKYLDVMKEYEEIKQQERELMVQLMELTKESRSKDKMGFATKDSGFRMPCIELSKNSADDGSKVKPSSNTISNTGNCEKPSTNPLNDLEALLKANSSAPLDTMKKLLTNNALVNKNNPLLGGYFIPTKQIRILENKTLKRPHELQKTVEALPSKEERNKTIDAKLQKVMQNFNRSLSRQSSQKLSKGHVKKGQLEKKFNEKIPQETKMEIGEETNNKQTGATQNLENLNLSQETNMAMNMMSQESVTENSTKANLEKFKLLPSNNPNVIGKNVADNDAKNSDNRNIKLPQKMHVDDENSATDSGKQEKSKLDKNGLMNTNSFKIIPGHSFVRSGQFSMNLGGNSFANPLTNGANNVPSDSNVFQLQTSGPNEIFTPVGIPFSQPFKMNKESHGNNPTDNVFKVPEAAPANTFPSQTNQNTSIISSGTNVTQKDSQAPQTQNESYFFNMHPTQYNFGSTMTQMTENENESYEMAWSPPDTDFSNNPAMDTNPLLPFGQPNTNFAFSFFK